MSTRVESLYAVMAFAFVVWSFARPSLLPVLLLAGRALVAGVHALAAIDARRDPRGRGPTEQDITDVRSRYPGGSGANRRDRMRDPWQLRAPCCVQVARAE